MAHAKVRLENMKVTTPIIKSAASRLETTPLNAILELALAGKDPTSKLETLQQSIADTGMAKSSPEMCCIKQRMPALRFAQKLSSKLGIMERKYRGNSVRARAREFTEAITPMILAVANQQATTPWNARTSMAMVGMEVTFR